MTEEVNYRKVPILIKFSPFSPPPLLASPVSMFQVVNFPNEACNGTDSSSQGTCYTSEWGAGRGRGGGAGLMGGGGLRHGGRKEEHMLLLLLLSLLLLLLLSLLSLLLLLY